MSMIEATVIVQTAVATWALDAKAALDVMLPKEQGEAGLPTSQATLRSVEERMADIDTRVSQARYRVTELKVDGGRLADQHTDCLLRVGSNLLRFPYQGASRARC